VGLWITFLQQINANLPGSEILAADGQFREASQNSTTWLAEF